MTASYGIDTFLRSQSALKFVMRSSSSSISELELPVQLPLLLELGHVLSLAFDRAVARD